MSSIIQGALIPRVERTPPLKKCFQIKKKKGIKQEENEHSGVVYHRQQKIKRENMYIMTVTTWKVIFATAMGTEPQLF